MNKDEALKLALEALETSMYPQQKQLQAITAIKEALAQPEQEPVAWYDIEHGEAETVWNKQRPPWEGRWKPLYTTPPPCPTCEALARTVMMDQTGKDV